MTTLVVGNAAHLDLILKSDQRPEDSGFGVLDQSPGSAGVWSKGGASFAMALMMVRLGAPSAVWHPLPGSRPDDEIGLEMMRRDGVDLQFCPQYEGHAVRCVIVYGEDWRMGWSAPPVPADFEGERFDWSQIEALVIAPVWGEWTEAALKSASAHGIPATLVGFDDPRAKNHNWARIIVDKAQADGLAGTSSDEWVITNGDQGARVLRSGKEIAKTAAHPAKVIDTTGAGDIFAASYMSAVFKGKSANEALELAARMAARICETWGSRPPREFFEI